MFVTDRPVSAGDGTLDVPEGGIDPLECRAQGGLAAGPGDDWLMQAVGVADAGEAAQAVTDDGAGGSEIALRQGDDFGPAEPLEAAQLQAAWLTAWRGFNRRHNRARRRDRHRPPRCVRSGALWHLAPSSPASACA